MDPSQLGRKQKSHDICPRYKLIGKHAMEKTKGGRHNRKTKESGST